MKWEEGKERGRETKRRKAGTTGRGGRQRGKDEGRRTGKGRK